MRRFLTVCAGLTVSTAAWAGPETVSTADAPAAVILHTCPVVQGWPQIVAATNLDLKYLVGADGGFLAAEVMTPSGDDRYDQAVLHALSRCQFLPALVAGKPAAGMGRHVVRAMPRPPAAQGSASIANVRECAPTSEDYPAESRRLNEQGTVRLRFFVRASGVLKDATVQRSSGYARLDDLALARLRNCMFSPGRDVDGKPIESQSDVDYIWKLE